MALFISLDGLDGSGKETQSRKLYDYLIGIGKKVRLLSFPTYDDEGCMPVKLYLSGKLGNNPSDTNAYAASSFFAVDRYISYRRDWIKDYLDDTIIIANRYTTANAVHQLSKLPKEQWDSFLSWLWDFEFKKLGLPEPDKVIYLKMPPEISERLIESRAEMTHTQKDIHESDDGHLRRSYEAAVYSAKKLGWITVDCCKDGNLRSIEDIHGEIVENLDL